MSLEDNALATVTGQKAYMKKADTADNSLLELLINSVSAFFDNYVGFQLRQKAYTDLYLDGNGQEELWLPFYPVAGITSLKENDIALTEGADEDYIEYSEEGLLVRVGIWLKGRKKIKITCKGGFKLLEKYHFDSGSTEPAVGDTLQGATGSYEGVLTKIVVTGGTWAGGDAEGWIEFVSVTGAFEDNENINIKDGAANILTINEPDSIILIPKDLQLACMQQCAVEFQRLTKKEWGETSRSFPDGSVSTSIEENLLSYVKEVLDRYRRVVI